MNSSFSDSLNSGSFKEVLNKNIINDRNLVKLFAAEAQKNENLKAELFNLIMKSKNATDENKEAIIAAANAITILVAGNVSFSGRNLNSIRINGANIRDGLFNFCDSLKQICPG